MMMLSLNHLQKKLDLVHLTPPMIVMVAASNANLPTCLMTLTMSTTSVKRIALSASAIFANLTKNGVMRDAMLKDTALDLMSSVIPVSSEETQLPAELYLLTTWMTLNSSMARRYAKPIKVSASPALTTKIVTGHILSRTIPRVGRDLPLSVAASPELPNRMLF